MKLDSQECAKALMEYETKNDTEELAVKVLLTADEDVVNIPGIQDMDENEIDKLAETIGAIRNEIGIEDEEV